MKKFYYLFALLMCMLGVQSASAQKTYHALVTFDDVPSIKAVTGVSVDGVVEDDADVYNHAPGVAFAEGADLKVLLDPAYVITKCLVETTDGNSVIAEQNINVTPNATAVNIPTDGNKHIWIKARKLVTDKYDIPYTIDTKDGVGVDPVVFMSKGAYSPLHELAHSGLKGGVVTDEFAEYLIIKPNALTDGYIKKVVFTTKDGDVEGVADGDGEYSIALEGLVSVYIEANEVDRGTAIVVNVDKNVALTTRFFDFQGQDKKYFFHYTINEVDSNDPAPEPTKIPNVGDNTVMIDPNYDFPLTIAFSNIYNSQGKVYIVAADGTKKAVEGQYTWTIDALADGESIAVEIGEPNRVTPVSIVVDKNIAKYTYSFDVVNAKHDYQIYHYGELVPGDPNPVLNNFPTEGVAETFKVDFDYDFPLDITIANIYSSDSKVAIRNIETGEVRTEEAGHHFTITPDFDPATEEIVVTVGEANRNTAVRMIVDKNVRQNTHSFDVINAKKDKLFYHWTSADPDPNDPNPATIVLPETETASVFNVDFNYDFPLNITIANIFGTDSKVVVRNIETGEVRDVTVESPGHNFTITPDFDPATEEIVVTVGEPNRSTRIWLQTSENVAKFANFFNVRGKHGDFFYYYDANAPEDDPNPIKTVLPEYEKPGYFYIDPNWDLPLEVQVMNKYGVPTSVLVTNEGVWSQIASENGVTFQIETIATDENIWVEVGDYPINRNTPVKVFVDKDVTKTTYHFSVEGKDNRAELDLAPNKFLHYMIGETDNVLPEVGGLTKFDVDVKYDLPLTVRFQNNFGEEGNDGFVVVEREVDGVKTFIEYAPNQEITDFDPATDVIRVYIGIKRDKLAFVRFKEKVEDNAYFFDIKAADITANHRGKTFMSYYQGQDCDIVINPDVNQFWYDATCELPLLVSFQTKPNLIQGTASVNVVNKYSGDVVYEAKLVEGSTGTYAIYSYDGTEQDIVIDWGKPVKERDQKVIVTVNEDVKDHAYTLFAGNERFLEAASHGTTDVYGIKFMDYTQGDEETINRGDYEWLINKEIDDVIIIKSNLKHGHSLTVLVNGVDVVNTQGEGSLYAEFELEGLKAGDHVNIRFDKDVTVGIDNVNANKLNGKIYTINGVEVKEATQPGLYIVNGKKVVVK